VKKLIGLVVLLGLLTLTSRGFTAEESEPIPEVPAKDMVTMLDLGAEKCIPCRLMASIIKELREEYKGKAAILFIDVLKHPEQSRKFNADTIPTLIFYDKSGKEIYRHEGILPKEGIVDIFKKAGVEVTESVKP